MTIVTTADGRPPPSGGDSTFAAGVVGGVAAFVAFAYYISGGAGPEAFSFDRDFGYSFTESGYYYRYGGRLNFSHDRWRLYWASSQSNGNGDFGNIRYSSGGEYDADFWRATFAESVAGETADYDFSLSTRYRGGIWEVSSSYRLHSEQTRTKTKTRNYLNLQGALQLEKWHIAPSAGFYWRRPDEFGSSAKFRLDMVRRF